MKTSKGQIFLFLFLLLATTVTGGLAWKYYNKSAQLSIQLLNPDERASQAKRIADYQKENKQLRDQLAALRGRRGGNTADDGSGDTPDAAAADANGGNQRRGRGNFGAMQAVMSSPEFQKLQAIQAKAALDVRYGALFKSLNLNPDQINQLKSLLVDRQQAATDALAAAREQGVNARSDPQDIRTAITAAQSAVDDQIKSTLGDAAFAQYQQYQQTLPQRGVVTQLQQSLISSGAPLTDAQSEQMVQILAQNAPQAAAQGGGGGGGARAFGGGGGPGGFGGGGGAAATITPQAITQAQGILSQSQLQALQAVQQQQQAQQQMFQLMRSAAQAARTPRGATAAAPAN